MEKEKRGFAAMDPRYQRKVASKGGKAAHKSGNGHEWTSEEAREVGRKGGIASHARRKAKLEEEAQRRSETSEPGNMGEM